MSDRLIVYSLRPLLRRGLGDALGLSRREARALLTSVWPQYRLAYAQLPAEQSIGGRVMARFAELTMAMYGALLQGGLSPQEAQERTVAVTWYAYDRLCRWPWRLSRLFGSDRLLRVQKLLQLAHKHFPYGVPDYRFEFLGIKDGEMGFDVHKCPVAGRFAARDLSALCSASFCDLDYPLADQWQVTLRRETTLATGGKCCTFRYRV